MIDNLEMIKYYFYRVGFEQYHVMKIGISNFPKIPIEKNYVLNDY